MRSKPRRKTTRATTPARSARRAQLRKSTPLAREVAVGAAALGILTLVVLIMMVVARPRANGAQADADAAKLRNEAASSALIEAATSDPVPPAEPEDSGTVTAPVTITGCLERSDDAFRLKDTEGEDAPRVRSWKSGFLKKSTASVRVVDGANRVSLSNHVGERITVTGTLIDREVRVRSLRRVASSCSAKTRV